MRQFSLWDLAALLKKIAFRLDLRIDLKVAYLFWSLSEKSEGVRPCAGMHDCTISNMSIHACEPLSR